MAEETKETLRKQRRLYIALLAVVILMISGIAYFIFDEESIEPNLTKKTVDLPGHDIDTNQILLSRLEKQNLNLESKHKFIDEVIVDLAERGREHQKENAELKQQIQTMRHEMQGFKELVREKESYPSPLPYQDHTYSSMSHEGIPMRMPLNELVVDKQEYRLKNVEKSIPAGTTVKAVLVSSVDANCSTFSSSDPQPVKLRILDNGHLPKSVSVALKGGIVIGSAHGDISSERAYIRLERLTQVNPNGDFIETEITGFVSGEDGKYGVRGVVVDRSEKQVKNAALSGFFSGVSQLAQSVIDAKYMGYYGCCEGDNKSFDPNILGECALNGASSAFDRLSEYYIKRSEQIRPVIQIDAGRIVDITFTHAADVGDLHTKRKLEELRKKTRGEVCERSF